MHFCARVAQGYSNIDLVFLSRAEDLDLYPNSIWLRTQVAKETKKAMEVLHKNMPYSIAGRLVLLQEEGVNPKLSPPALAAVSDHGKQLAQILEQIRAKPLNRRVVWCLYAGNFGIVEERDVSIIHHVLFCATSFRKTSESVVNGMAYGKGWIVGSKLLDGTELLDASQISLAEFLAQPIICIPVQSIIKHETSRLWRTQLVQMTMFHNKCCGIPSCKAEACKKYQIQLDNMSEAERKAEDVLNMPLAAPLVDFDAPSAGPGKGRPNSGRKKAKTPDSASEEEDEEEEEPIDVTSDESVKEYTTTEDEDLSDLGEHDTPSYADGAAPSAACLDKMWVAEKKQRCREISKTNKVKAKYRKHFRESQGEIKRLKSTLKGHEKIFAGVRKAVSACKSVFGAALGPHAKGKVVEARPSGKGKERKQESDSEGY